MVEISASRLIISNEFCCISRMFLAPRSISFGEGPFSQPPLAHSEREIEREIERERERERERGRENKKKRERERERERERASVRARERESERARERESERARTPRGGGKTSRGDLPITRFSTSLASVRFVCYPPGHFSFSFPFRFPQVTPSETALRGSPKTVFKGPSSRGFAVWYILPPARNVNFKGCGGC